MLMQPGSLLASDLVPPLSVSLFPGHTFTFNPRRLLPRHIQVFDINYELDLIVVNIADGIMKSGMPNHAQSFNIADYQEKWIEIRMQKTGSSCSTTISNAASGEELSSSVGGTCNLAAEGSRVVINARARDGTDTGDSFVSIRKVMWQPN